jgi:Ion channel
MAINSIRILSKSGPLSRERRSKFLLISIILFFVLAPLIEDREIGALALIFNLYLTLVASTIELAENRILLRSAIPIAACSMFLLLFSHFHRTPALLIASGVVLALFFLLVSVSLFAHLGQASAFSNSRLYASVSLYFLLALTWFATYNVINLLQPGSFMEMGVPLNSEAHWSTFLYFSLTTLTTLGYGDIVAVKPTARMIATLEAAAGVLYIAITVARLVAAAGTEKASRNE